MPDDNSLASNPQPDREIKCVVSCQAADGRPSFYLARIRCTQKQYEDGVHYAAAREACGVQEYTNIGLVYDEYDGPEWLHRQFDWSSVDVRSVPGNSFAQSRSLQRGPSSPKGRGDHRADLMLPNGQVTIDDALRILTQAKAQLGGDKCLLLCLAASELEDVDVNQLSIIDDRPRAGESTYVQVLVSHPALVCETWRRYRGRYRLVAETATYAQGERIVRAVDEQTARSAVVDWVNEHDPHADARTDYIVAVDSVEPCEEEPCDEEHGERNLYRLLLEAAPASTSPTKSRINSIRSPRRSRRAIPYSVMTTRAATSAALRFQKRQAGRCPTSTIILPARSTTLASHDRPG